MSDDHSDRLDSLACQLRALPELKPPSDGWPALTGELDRQASKPRRLHWWAVAAAALLAAIWLPRHTDQTEQAEPASDSETAQWVAYSQALELQLHELRAGAPSYRGEHAAILSELEDRVATVDWQLELPLSALEQRELWQQRISLLHDMVTVERSNRFAGLLADNDRNQPVRTLNRPLAEAAGYQL